MPNPLLEFKKSNDYTWPDMARLSKMSTAQINRLAFKTPQDLLRVQLKTILLLRKRLKIDLILYLEQFLAK